MNLKNIITLLLISTLFSCQEDNDTSKGMVPIRIIAGINSKDCLYSRVNSQGDEEVSRCLVEIVMDGTSQGVETMEGNEASGFTLNTSLYKGKSYDLYFWADRGSNFYDATDLTAVSLVAPQKPTVAYHGKRSFIPGDENHTLALSLTHAVAKVSYVTTSDLQIGKTVTMNIPRVYHTFNVSQAQASGTSYSKDYIFTLSENITANSVVFSEYAFVDNEVQNIELSYTYAPTVTVSNAPIATNVHTTLKGDISNQATIGVTASISSSWTNEINQSYDEDLDGVDLGENISVIWATCNLGASSPTDFGNYYQWGSTEPCEAIPLPNSNVITITAEWDENDILKPEYDAATANDPHWRMPTIEEFSELLSLTQTNITTAEGIQVAIFTSTNGYGIIFPYAGYYSLSFNNSKAMYWSSTFYTTYVGYYTAYAAILNENPSRFNGTYRNYYKFPIRPVRDKPKNN